MMIATYVRHTHILGAWADYAKSTTLKPYLSAIQMLCDATNKDTPDRRLIAQINLFLAGLEGETCDALKVDTLYAISHNVRILVSCPLTTLARISRRARNSDFHHHYVMRYFWLLCRSRGRTTLGHRQCKARQLSPSAR